MNELTLAPWPKSVTMEPGRFAIPDAFGNRLRNTLRSTPDGELRELISLEEVPSFADEEYELLIGTSGATLRYSGVLGRLWGVRTLEQIVRQAEEGTIPCCTIRDIPDYPVRGVMLDVSRDRVPQMETLYALIDLWSSLKINHLQLYIEHTFAYEGHEIVWRHASPFTLEEIESIKHYCYERGIELVPNQNSFGHMERWLKHDRYKHLAECPEGFTDFGGVFRPAGTCLSPAVPESIDFLAELYDQFLPHFDATMFNVGGDEPWELCQGRSADLCAERGHGQVYVDFLKRIHEQVAARGRRMLCFGDIITQHPELVSELPKDVVVLNWGYEANHPFERESTLFEEANREFYLLAGTSSWNSIGGRWQNAHENIRRAADVGLAHGASGFIVTDWGDNGHMQQLPISLPGWTYAAAVSWGVTENRELEVESPLALHLLGGETGNDLAGAILALGDVYLNEPIHLPNATVIAATLLRGLTPYYESMLPKCGGSSFEPTREAIERVRESLRRVEARLEAADAASWGPNSRVWDPGTFLRELGWTADLIELGVDLAAELYEKEVWSFSGIPDHRRAALAERLDALKNEYIELWHQRSRPGGLNDSLANLALLEEALGTATEHRS